MKLYYKFIITNTQQVSVESFNDFIANFGVRKIWIQNLIIFTLISEFSFFSLIEHQLSHFIGNEEHRIHIYEDYED